MKIFDSDLRPIKKISDSLKITEGSIVQVAGSGGKTTLISTIAEENSHLKTAILTTTKRYIPSKNGYILKPGEILCPSNISERIVEIGTLSSNEKIGWIGIENYEIVKDWADLILIEADGSKRLPLKAASDYEPVFVEDSTHTVIVCGLSAFYKKIQDVCHRYELIESKYHEDTLVSEDIISYLLNRYYFKPFSNLNPFFILNQADNEKLQQIGVKILNTNNFPGLITSFI